MRILVVNVNTSATMTETVGAAARRYASPGTEIIPVRPRFGPASVDSAFESYLSAVGVIDRVLHCGETFDAVVMAGFGEPGRDALAELLAEPVVEICEASAHMAMLVGRSYSVVTTLRRSIPMIEDRLRLAGLSDRCASVRACGLSTAAVDADPASAVSSVVDEARRAVELDGAEVICLGCAGMAGLEDAVRSALTVPVVDGVGAAVRLAEATVGLGLVTSKVGTYADPPVAPMSGWPLTHRAP